jgi:hypothetical protein
MKEKFNAEAKRRKDAGILTVPFFAAWRLCVEIKTKN